MQFLGVGWQEILLVGVLAFFVLGPERMPAVAYQIGKAVRTLQQYARAVRDEFGEEIGYVEEQYRTVRGDLDSARTEIRQQQRQIESEWRAQQREVESGIKEAQDAVEGAAKVVNISDRANGAATNVTATNGKSPEAVPAGAPSAEAAAAPAITEPTNPNERPGGPPLVF